MNDERKKIPERGDVFYADLTGIEESIGSEQSGRRPVLVIQNNRGNVNASTTIVAVMSTKLKSHLPTHVIFDNRNILPCRSAVYTEQIKTIAQCRLDEYCGNVGSRFMKVVDDVLAYSIGINREEEMPLLNPNADTEMVKRETFLDTGDYDWLEILGIQQTFFENVQQHVVNLKIDSSTIDAEMDDILTYIENTNYNVPQGFNIYKMLQNRCRQKRKIEKELAGLEVFLNVFDCNEMFTKYQKTLFEMQNAIQEKENVGNLREKDGKWILVSNGDNEYSIDTTE